MSFPTVTSDTSSAGMSALYYIESSSNNIWQYTSPTNPEIAQTGMVSRYKSTGPITPKSGSTKLPPTVATTMVALGFVYSGKNYARIFYIDKATNILSELMLDQPSGTTLPAPAADAWAIGELQNNKLEVAPNSPITAHVVDIPNQAPQMKVFYFPKGSVADGTLTNMNSVFITIPGDSAASWKSNRIA